MQWNEDHLHILWTNGDSTTGQHMVLMYATNAVMNGWWKAVTVVLWGAPAQLAVQDEAVRERIHMAMHAGVKFSACIACADRLGVTGALTDMGVEVMAWGQPLTQLLKENRPLITI
ncbi:DsrE family protein [Eubacteriales bacterium OttesenSCG-928-M02]|nr:DsrE family protein [Eubacteriales bacterium OttesenSCG-928-M02]